MVIKIQGKWAMGPDTLNYALQTQQLASRLVSAPQYRLRLTLARPISKEHELPGIFSRNNKTTRSAYLPLDNASPDRKLNYKLKGRYNSPIH